MRMIKLLKKLANQKSIVYTGSTVVCFSACAAYLLNSDDDRNRLDKNDLEQKRIECKRLIKRFKEEHGIPGVVVGVSIDGQTVFKKGFGYSDVENNHKANENTVMRIASISKPITCTVAGKLLELGKLDLDKSVNEYLNYLPVFKWKDKNVVITPRLLMSHKSGIRHYDKNVDLEKKKDDSENKNNNKSVKDTDLKEFYNKTHYDKSSDALSLFINDKLLFEPNTNFYYTTYAYTLLSVVLEKLSDRTFPLLLNNLFKYLSMNQTFIDENDPLVANRSRYYTRNDKGRLQNVPYVDNSCKWAGGGILSSVGDLMKYGNHMLYCYQNDDPDNFLKRDTIRNHIWSKQSVPVTFRKDVTEQQQPLVEPLEKEFYGFGWFLVFKNANLQRVYHTGGALGASSCLLISPSDENTPTSSTSGIVVAVLCNSDKANGIASFTQEIAKIFTQ